MTHSQSHCFFCIRVGNPSVRFFVVSLGLRHTCLTAALHPKQIRTSEKQTAPYPSPDVSSCAQVCCRCTRKHRLLGNTRTKRVSCSTSIKEAGEQTKAKVTVFPRRLWSGTIIMSYIPNKWILRIGLWVFLFQFTKTIKTYRPLKSEFCHSLSAPHLYVYRNLLFFK